jgi:hypothetical protein
MTNTCISNTAAGPIQTGFVASERKVNWAHFGTTIVGVIKYYQSFNNTLQVKIFIFGFYCGFCFHDDIYSRTFKGIWQTHMTLLR